MKYSQWVKDNFTSHGIFDHQKTAAEFVQNFGEPVPWTPYRAYSLATADKKDHRSASLKEGTDINQECIGGFEIVEALVGKYAYKTESAKAYAMLSGRGSRFRMGIQALEEAGL